MADGSDTQRIAILLEMKKDEFERNARTAENAISRLERKFDPLAAAETKLEKQQRKLNAALQAGTLDAKRHQQGMEYLQREFDQTKAKIEGTTQSLGKMNAAQVETGSVLQRNKGAFQQLGYQVGDFAVQVQGGTSAAVAFTQQGSQMLGAIGPMGAIMGAALAVGVPLGAALIGAGDGAEKAGDGVDEFTSALDEYMQYSDLAQASTADLRAEFGDFADEMKEYARYMANVAMNKALTNLSGAVGPFREGFREAISDLREYERAIEEFKRAEEQKAAGVATSEQVLMMREIMNGARDDADKSAASLGLMRSQVEAVADALEGVEKAEGMTEVRDRAKEALDLILQFYPEGSRLPPVLEEAVGELYKVVRATSSAVEEAKELADEFERAGSAVSKIEGYQSYARGRAHSDQQWRQGNVRNAGQMLREFEGFSAKAYWDVNAYRAGYGSDTITLADGSIRKITEGMTVTRADAERDLARRIAEFQQGIVREIGLARWVMMDAGQRAALTSVAYNYGSIGRGGANISGVVKNGTDAQIVKAIEALGSHNGGINRSRRMTEAAVFGGAGIDQTAALSDRHDDEITREKEKAAREAEREEQELARERKRLLDEEIRERKRLAEIRTKFTEESARLQAAQELEIEMIGKSVGEQARLRTEFELTNKAKREGIDLSEQVAGTEQTYGQLIRETAAAVGQAAEQEDRLNNARERAEEKAKFMVQVQDDLKNGLLDAIMAGDSFADTLGNVAQMLARAAMQAALFGDGPFGGGGGGLLGAVWSGISGARADGGPVASGKSYLVGERGPEIFTPNTMGAIIPNHKIGGASGGGGQTDVRVYVDQDGNWQAAVERISGQTVQQAAPAIQSRTMAATQKQMRTQPKSAWGIR
ncbi:glycoside hydrolase family protein [Limimaricola cinnabarinus]|uniref:glycoside hydrolase family protein n=1 Tax=Limimaricola cinnabarinus TaxID=1125964 RepID=UPI0024908046|nr:hypothetical protein [Limimaricola cinnabarinus]